MAEEVSATITINDGFSGPLDKLKSGLNQSSSGMGKLKSTLNAMKPSNILGMNRSMGSMNNALAKGNGLFGKFLGANVIGAGVTKGIQTITSSVGDAVKRIDTLDNSTRSFKNMGFSAKKTTKAMDYLDTAITGLPTPMDMAVRNTQMLASSTGDIGKSAKVFGAMNNAIMGFGGTAAQVDNAVLQLSQSFANGNIDGQTWNSMLNSNMGPALKAIAKEMGVTTGQLKTGLSKGKISVNDFQKALIDLDKNGGGGLQSLQNIAQDSTKGISTSLANLKTSVVRVMATGLGKMGKGGLTDFINGITAGIKASEPLIAKGMDRVMNSITTITPKIGSALRTVKTMISEVFEGIGDTGASKAISASFTEIGTAASNMFKDVSRADGGNFFKSIGQFAGGGIKGVATIISSIAQALSRLDASEVENLALAFVALKGGVRGLVFTGVVAGLNAVKNSGQDLTNVFEGVLRGISNFVDGIKTALSAAVDTGMFDKIKDAAKSVGKTLSQMGKNVGSGGFFSSIGKLSGGVIGGIANAIKGISDALRGMNPNALKLLAAGFVALKAGTSGLVLTGVVAGLKMLSTVPPEKLESLGRAIIKLAAGFMALKAIKGVTDVIGNLTQALSGGGSGVISGVVTKLTSLPQIITSATTGIVPAVTGAMAGVKGAIAGGLGGIKVLITTTFAGLAGPVGLSLMAVTAVIVSAVSAWRSNFANIQGFMSSAFSGIGNIFAPLVSAIQSLKTALEPVASVLLPMLATAFKAISVGTIVALTVALAAFADGLAAIVNIISAAVHAIGALVHGLAALSKAMTLDFSGAKESFAEAGNSLGKTGDSFKNAFRADATAGAVQALSQLGSSADGAKGKVESLGNTKVSPKVDTAQFQSQLNSFQGAGGTKEIKVKAGIEMPESPFAKIQAATQGKKVQVPAEVKVGGGSDPMAQIKSKVEGTPLKTATPQVPAPKFNQEILTAPKIETPKVPTPEMPTNKSMPAPKVETPKVPAPTKPDMPALKAKVETPKIPTPSKPNMPTLSVKVTKPVIPVPSKPNMPTLSVKVTRPVIPVPSKPSMPTLKANVTRPVIPTPNRPSIPSLTVRVNQPRVPMPTMPVLPSIPAPKIGRPSMGGVVSAVSAGMEQAAAAARAGGAAMTAAVRGVVNQAVAAARAGAGAMRAAGSAIGAGLASGMRSQVGAVNAAASDLVAAANKAARAKAKIHSPSKLFAEVGDYMGQGMVVGMAGDTRDIANTAKTLAETAINGATLQHTSPGDILAKGLYHAVTAAEDLAHVMAGMSDENVTLAGNVATDDLQGVDTPFTGNTTPYGTTYDTNSNSSSRSVTIEAGAIQVNGSQTPQQSADDILFAIEHRLMEEDNAQ